MSESRPHLTRIRMIIFFGKPGCGKTYLSTRLASLLGFVRLSTDETRQEMFRNPSFGAEETATLWSALEGRLATILESGRGILVDGSVGRVSYRKRLAERFFPAEPQRCCSVYVACPDDLALSRIAVRSLPDNPFGCSAETFAAIGSEIEFSGSEKLFTFENSDNDGAAFRGRLALLLHDLEAYDKTLSISN